MAQDFRFVNYYNLPRDWNQPVWVSQSDRFTTRTGEDGPIWTDQIRRLQILVVISCYIHIMWLKQCHVYHPPVITI